MATGGIEHSGYVEVDNLTAEEAAQLSVKELRKHLREAGTDCSACVEKSELVALLLKQPRHSTAGAAAAASPFLKNTLGAAAALSAEHSLKVMGFSVAQLKAYLREQHVDFGGVTEKDELQQLALHGKDTSRPIGGQGDVADYLLEC